MQIDSFLVWLIAGFALVIVELVTGTFYLLVLGVAAFAGAGLAYAGAVFAWHQDLGYWPTGTPDTATATCS